MTAFLRKLFEKYARQLIVSGGEGITKIPNKDRVKALANSIYTDFREAGVRDNMIKSEADIKFLHTKVNELYETNLTRNLKKQLERLKPKESADVLDLTGKKIDTSKPILGGKNVPETEAQIKTKLEGMNKQTVERIRRKRYQAALKAEREKSAKDPDYLPKVLDPEDFAYGGIAGMLGERTGYENGQLVQPGLGRPGYGRIGLFEGGEMTNEDWAAAEAYGDKVENIVQDRGDGSSYEDRYNQMVRKNTNTAPVKRTIREKIGGGINRVFNNPLVRGYAAWGSGGLSEKLRSAMIAKNLYENRDILVDEEVEDEIRNIPITGGIVSQEIPPTPDFNPRFASGGVAGLLGEPTYADDNHRVPFKKGYSAGRRNFLKGIAALATVPIIGKYFKWAKPLAKSSKVLTSVPIKSGADGMPAWFKPLVNKVIKEGDDVTKKFATQERQIVHKTKLPDSQTDVIVTQNLDSGDVVVDIGWGKHGFKAGHHGQPVRLEYKAAEDIMTGPDMDAMVKTGMKKDPHVRTKTKTKEEFWVEEAEFTGGHPENIKFEESTFEKFGNHGSNFDEVEKFATGKVTKIRPGKESIDRLMKKEQAGRPKWPEDDFASGGRVPLSGGGGPDKLEEAIRAYRKYQGSRKNPRLNFQRFFEIYAKENFATGGRVPLKKGKVPKVPNEWLQLLDIDWDDWDPYDYQKFLWSLGVEKAEGGRVPLFKGKLAKYATPEGLAKLIEKLFPGTTKLGKTSKPLAEKTQLRRAIADFQNRDKHKTLLDDFNKKYTVKQETKISSEQVGSLDEFHADFVKETGINIPKENLKQAWNIKKSYPFNTPIVDKTGKVLGGEATQQMYPKSKKFIVKDSDALTREIEGKLPSGERAGIDVPDMPEGFKLSREKLEQNFPELGLDEIDEIMNLDKEMQGTVITMLKNRRLDPDLYDELLLKHGDTLKFQGEFDKAIRRKKNASGGIIGRVPYWGGGSWKAIKEAIKHNKIFGLGGPPYKPGATSFDIKKLTKDRFGTELSLQELKEMGIKEGSFSKFKTGFKEYKADVIKQQLLDSKRFAKIRMKLAKEMLETPPANVDLAMNKKISSQMIRDSEKQLKDLDAALKDIDVYKAMKEKTGVASHASGGRVSLSSGGLAGMLGE